MDAGDEYLVSQPLLADLCFYKQGRSKLGEQHTIGVLTDHEKWFLHKKPVSDFFTLSLEAFLWLVVKKYIINKYYDLDHRNLTAITSFLNRNQDESFSTQYVRDLVDLYKKNTYTTPQIEVYLQIFKMLKNQQRIALPWPGSDENIDEEARRRYKCIYFIFPTEGGDTTSSSSGETPERTRVTQRREVTTDLTIDVDSDDSSHHDIGDSDDEMNYHDYEAV